MSDRDSCCTWVFANMIGREEHYSTLELSSVVGLSNSTMEMNGLCQVTSSQVLNLAMPLVVRDSSRNDCLRNKVMGSIGVKASSREVLGGW